MFIGHYAIAFAAKRLAPGASLGTLFLAAALVDLVWPLLLLGGVERAAIRPRGSGFSALVFDHYPWTHSLLACALWALALGVGYRLLRRDTRAALVVGALVLSHWLLDVLTHPPDVLLWPGGQTKVGLALWSSVPATLSVEGSLFALGVALYLRSTRARDWTGEAGFWVLIGFLLAAYLGAAFGPPPPSLAVLAGTGLAAWLVVLWGYWIDRHRGVSVPN
ncbi:MAG: metal-dependent hydrolase [Acidobacteriota bacterium]|nr:metal-dependent hydrolase [Acidobacteriota bacterium]